jgi:DNA-binding beta-propeller fold protein YncE
MRWLLALGLFAMLPSEPAAAQDLMVSAQDGKYVRKDGANTYPRPAPSDSVAVIDVSVSPPKIVSLIEGVQHSVQGPPQAVAMTPDRRLILIGATDHFDPATGGSAPDSYLQVVDLAATPAKISRVELGAQPQGVAISPDGALALAATVTGTVEVVAIAGGAVTRTQTLKIASGRLASVAFTHDGQHALVSMRDDGGVMVLAIRDGRVENTGEHISAGLGPYAIDVSSDGRWAVVGSVGLVSPLAPIGTLVADVDVVTLVDVSKRPFRAVQHLTVPAAAEGVAISPDGRWIAVQSMSGSNLPPVNPYRAENGRIVLFEIRNGRAVETDSKPAGAAGQGIAFAADSKTIVVQFNVEKALGVFRVERGKLTDTGIRLPFAAGPASLRTLPR